MSIKALPFGNQPDYREYHLDQILDISALDAGEFFNYIESPHRDLWFGWPNIGHWYTYREITYQATL